MLRLASLQLALPPAILLLAASFDVPARAADPPAIELLGGGLRIVENGRATVVIYHAPDAPASVRRAASEIRRVIRRITDAELPIVTEPAERMICLGDNDLSRRAGVTNAADSPADTFALFTRPGAVYIVGKDSPDEPGDDPAWASRGTLYGAYSFLEFLGVEWLMPGEWGEDLPPPPRGSPRTPFQSTLDAPRFATRDRPAFFARTLQDVQDRRPPDDPGPNEAKIWLEHQKISSMHDGQKLGAGHSWDDFISPEQAAEHPEWLAKDTAGKPRQFARHKAIKFCTREPELIEAFVEGVNRRLKANPKLRCASISASDGGDFCQCPKCAPSIERDPHGRPSYSRLMVEFYDVVARRVAKTHPDRLVCGLVYYNYAYPPPALRIRTAPAEPLAENLWLAWAPLNYYGWGLAKPVYYQEFESVAAGWRAVTPNLAYHNYSTWMRSYNGAPIPPALTILKKELPGAYAAGFRGTSMVGLGAWGYGAPTNYILAKQMWDPKIDVETTYREWLKRAYGPGWQSMRELYRQLETAFMERKRTEAPEYRGQMYEVNYELLAEVHAPRFRTMEQLYLAALSHAETEPQRKRLEMFGENLIRLHHDLREAGLFFGAGAEQSTFHRNEAAYKKFLAETEFSYAQYRDHRSRYLVPVWKGEYRGE